MTSSNAPNSASRPVNPWVIETSPERFQHDVIERSKQIPVVVDFWAAWCGPCRMLGPLLERLAHEYDGQFVLVKAETDRMPSIASQFGVQSIPAVFAVRDGRIIDQFVGVLPETELRAWIERLLPTEAQKLVDQARSLESASPREAEEIYRQAIGLDATEAAAKIGLLRLLLQRGDLDESRKLLDELESRGYLEPEAETLRARWELMRLARECGDVATCRRAWQENPDDLNTALRLAAVLALDGQYQEAMDLCLDVFQRDRANLRTQAQKLLLDILHLLEPDSELATEYRRKLSMLMY